MNPESAPVARSANTVSMAEVDQKSAHTAARKSRGAAASNTPIVKRRIVKVDDLKGARGGVQKLPGKAFFERIGLRLFARRHVWYH